MSCLRNVSIAEHAWFDRACRIANLEAATALIAEARAAGVELLRQAERDLARAEEASAAEEVRMVALAQQLTAANEKIAELSRLDDGPPELAGVNVIAIKPIPGVRGSDMAELIAKAITTCGPARSFAARTCGEVR